MPEKRPVKFWGSTKEAGFAAFSNAIMKSCRPSCRPATFGFQAFPALWPARSVGTISAQHGLEEIKNPKKIAGRQLFGGPRQRPPCRSISSGPAYFRGLLRLCVRPASRPAPRPMLKGTDFPYKDSRPPKRPPEWEGAALFRTRGGAMLGFPVDLAPSEANSGLQDAENR
jgi:hypothetical protein